MPQELERNIPSLGIGIREAADILGVSESHIRHLVKSGELPSIKLGKRYVLSRSHIEGLLHPIQEKPQRGRPRKVLGA